MNKMSNAHIKNLNEIAARMLGDEEIKTQRDTKCLCPEVIL